MYVLDDNCAQSATAERGGALLARSIVHMSFGPPVFREIMAKLIFQITVKAWVTVATFTILSLMKVPIAFILILVEAP